LAECPISRDAGEPPARSQEPASFCLEPTKDGSIDPFAIGERISRHDRSYHRFARCVILCWFGNDQLCYATGNGHDTADFF
jgi:hypothetical protein